MAFHSGRDATASPGADEDDMAYQEWTTFGGASYFRRLVVQSLTRNQIKSDAPWLVLKGDEETETDEVWASCVSLYLQGHLEEAVDVLPLQTSTEHFAAAMLWLEMGESRQALRELEQAISTSPDQAGLIAAKYWHLSGWPPVGFYARLCARTDNRLDLRFRHTCAHPADHLDR